MNGPLSGSAALCLHGFGSTPFEMRGLAGVLEAAGCVVSAPLLPGHGTSPEDWNRTGFDHWAGAVEREYDRLAGLAERVFVCGLSMGGLLALHLGAVRRPAAIAALAAPVFLYRFYPLELTDWRLPLLPLFRRVRPLWPTAPGGAESRRIAPWQGYEGVIALGALAGLMDGMRRVRARLGEVTAPLLALHSPGDVTVPLSSSMTIMAGVSSAVRRLELLPVAERTTSRHLLTTHRDTRPRVERLVPEFFAQSLEPAAGPAGG